MSLVLVCAALCAGHGDLDSGAIRAEVDPIVLDNGSIRVEVDPAVFAVRFVGVPGGANMLMPLFVRESTREGSKWADAGGLYAELVSSGGEDAALRRGPAEVIDRGEGYVALLGPPSDALGIRLKKEIRLDPGEARAVYTVTALSVSRKRQSVALRNVVRLPLEVTLRPTAPDAPLRVVEGPASVRASVDAWGKDWVIAVPSEFSAREVVLGARVSGIVHERAGMRWLRRIRDFGEGETAYPDGLSFVCRLDDKHRVYLSILQGSVQALDASSPITFAEEWVLEER